MERKTSLKLEKKKENHFEVLIKHMTKYKIIKTNLRCFCISIFVLAIYFLVISVVLTFYARSDFLYSVRYDDKCVSLSECEFIWNLDKDLEAPVFILFGFEDFYVNHRSIALSVNEEQLVGESNISEQKLKETCGQNALINEDLIKLGHAVEDPSNDEFIIVNEVQPRRSNNRSISKMSGAKQASSDSKKATLRFHADSKRCCIRNVV